jgi:hypothetical protein
MNNPCPRCGDDVPQPRQRLGYKLCLACGEASARMELRRKASMCLPINKSTPTYISDPMLLHQLNPKRT